MKLARRLGAVSRDIEMLFEMGTAAGVSDRELLERFARGGDEFAEAAFEILLLRHGAMVLRVCRNLLRNSNDAEDAFQATFLVLVRRRGSIGRHESFAGWLYGVACRVAARARTDAARRRTVEHRARLRVVPVFSLSDDDEAGRLESDILVQEEVRRLPAKYRDVILPCYWQGLTHEQVAAQLGCPVGTVRSRIARARDLLRGRLTRRGLAPMALTGLPGWESHFAMRCSPVPDHLIRSTMTCASQVANSGVMGTAATAGVACLIERTLWSMTMSKIGGVVAGVALLGIAGYGVGIAVSNGQVVQARREGTKNDTPPRPQATTAPSATVSSSVKYETSILKIVPNGSRVKKGDLVCELDPAALWDALTNQQITTAAAEANLKNAKLTREAAEHEVTVYVDDLLPREKRETEGELKLAESELALAEDQQKAAREINANKGLTLRQGEVAIARAKLAKEKAMNRLHVLEAYTKDKHTRQLKDDVSAAYSNELAKRATWTLEKSKEEKLKRQSADCKVLAPQDGIVVYANPPGGQVLIEEGAVVRQGQMLFQVIGEGLREVR
jgi:HlyD family secretion protein